MNKLEGGQVLELLVLVDAVGEVRLLVVVECHDRVDHHVFQNLGGRKGEIQRSAPVEEEEEEEQHTSLHSSDS